ncbi:MAG: tetratricopeptide repeat protein, partial [Nitrospirota bacterium]|nr:tetratricopeptide repeat protein [Nitrospirota bacterium]
DLAKRQFEETLRVEPNFAPAATAIGWILYDKGQDDFAMDYFSRALKANPDDAQATFGVGRIYEEKRKPELAVQHYQRALSLEKDPDRKIRIINFMDKLLG